MSATDRHPDPTIDPAAAHGLAPHRSHLGGDRGRDRLDPYAPDPSTPRRLVLWIWYPTEPTVAGAPAELLPGPWAPIADQLGVDVEGLRTHAVADAPAGRSAQPRAAPLAERVLTAPARRHRRGAGQPRLRRRRRQPHVRDRRHRLRRRPRRGHEPGRARRGARPAGRPPRGGVPSPRRGLRVQGRRPALRRRPPRTARPPTPPGSTSDHLDLTAIGAFGHSFGGNAALEWCRADPRCRAAANLDGAVWTEVGTVGLPRPALQILADHPEFALTGADAVAAGIAADPAWHDAERMLARDGWRNVDRLARPGHTARIAGSTHMSFMDVPFLPVRPGTPRRRHARRHHHPTRADVATHQRPAAGVLRRAPRRVQRSRRRAPAAPTDRRSPSGRP